MFGKGIIKSPIEEALMGVSQIEYRLQEKRICGCPWGQQHLYSFQLDVRIINDEQSYRDKR